MVNRASRIKFITFTGRPGSGKSTLVKKLLSQGPPFQAFSGKSFTTRFGRSDDVSGEYEHVEDKLFETMENSDSFLWTASHGGNKYGTRASDVDDALNETESISLMTLVPEAVSQLHEYVGSSRIVSFLVLSPREEILLQRLVSRGENEALSKARLLETKEWERFARRTSVPYYSAFNSDEEEHGATAFSFVTDVLRYRDVLR